MKRFSRQNRTNGRATTSRRRNLKHQLNKQTRRLVRRFSGPTRRPQSEGTRPGQQPAAGGPRPQVSIPQQRIHVLLLTSFILVAVVTMRLFNLQIVQQESLSAMARGEIMKHITLRPARGTITDRQGNILAMDVEQQGLWVNPSQISPEQANKFALILSPLVGKDVEELLPLFSRDDLQWVRVARWIKPSAAQQIAALNEPLLHLIYEPRRVYPQKDFAAHVIGPVNDNGEGVIGVESFYNTMLKGVTGTLKAEFDSRQNPIAIAPLVNEPARDGVDLRLTIDPLIQHVAETELQKGVEKNDADGGVVIVMEPATGAIRGMAVSPSFDLNRYSEYTLERYGRNPAVSTLYEPGSTFKIVTVAAGLQTRAFTADTLVNDTGTINRFDMRIHNWNHLGNGMITPKDMLYYSSNVGAVKLNELTGADPFYQMVYRFGFGAPTGVDLGGEEQGIVNDPSTPGYNDVLALTNAYGQGIAVTPLQMVQAAAVIANDGVMMQPYIVEERCWQETAETEDESGAANPLGLDESESAEDISQECEVTQPTHIDQVIEPGVAWTVRRMMVHAANHYAPVVWGPKTGNHADQWLVPGYEVCAKTGTASIPLPEGGYDPQHVIGSVLGFAPAEDTRYVVLVKVDRPKRDAWGLATAIPIFYNIVEELMRYERIPPDPNLFSTGQGGT